MYTIILRIVSVNQHLLLCQPLQLQDPNCCCCTSCFHSISLPLRCPSSPPSLPASLLPSFFVDALAPNIPSGRQRRDSSNQEKQREYGDHRKGGGKREVEYLTQVCVCVRRVNLKKKKDTPCGIGRMWRSALYLCPRQCGCTSTKGKQREER